MPSLCGRVVREALRRRTVLPPWRLPTRCQASARSSASALSRRR